jgi:RNA polymerase sigma-70 factor (ECF subfamily)
MPEDAQRLRFEGCFRDNYTAVLAFAVRRTVDKESAEDAASETFAVAWRRRDLIPAEPRPWLYGIAMRVLANQQRSAGRRQRLAEQIEREIETQERAGEPPDAVERRDTFSSAFGRLGEEDRETLRLVAWDGLDAREAASVLGCSAAAFRVRLYRARRRLAKHLAAAGHSTHQHGEPNPAEEAV